MKNTNILALLLHFPATVKNVSMRRECMLESTKNQAKQNRPIHTARCKGFSSFDLFRRAAIEPTSLNRIWAKDFRLDMSAGHGAQTR